ncbi:hypothetical protein KNSL1_000849 [Colletotrichum chrysophilum]|nr:hypothetical protein KNSL1_000849 [Colletotrichum chrysophilum]
MAQNLESIFQELGISQYLDIFLEQGFDTWDTILDITESDLSNLTPAEKEPYETSALKAKEKYNHDLAEYKKTPEFRKYTAYLADFKARQASANQGEMLCFIPTPMHY